MQETASPVIWSKGESTSHATVASGAAAIGWATMCSAVAFFVYWFEGESTFWSTLGMGLFAAVPSGVGGWICAATARKSPKAAWPLLIVPGSLLGFAAVITAISIIDGPSLWKDPKADPILIVGLTVMASGPTLLACMWARWSTRPVSEQLQSVE